MAATLANGGGQPVTKTRRCIDAKDVPAPAVMRDRGLYDDSGKWFFHTGLPA